MGEVFGRTQEHSKLMIECLLTPADIFWSHDPTSMTNDYFWKHVRRPSKSGNSREHSKEQMEYTTAEKTIIDRVNGVTMDTEDEIMNGFPNVDDDDVSVCSSVGGDQDPVRLAVTDIIEDEDETINQQNIVTDEDKVKDALIGLKAHGNMRRRPLHQHATKDLFRDGSILLKKTVVKN